MIHHTANCRWCHRQAASNLLNCSLMDCVLPHDSPSQVLAITFTSSQVLPWLEAIILWPSVSYGFWICKCSKWAEKSSISWHNLFLKISSVLAEKMWDGGSWVGITLQVSAHGSCCGWLWKGLGLYWVDHCSCCTSMRGKCSSLLEWECSLLSTCRTWLEVPLGQPSSTNSQLNSKYRSKKVFLA